MIESQMLTTTRVTIFDGKRPLTGASGFFFERDGRLFIVTGEKFTRATRTRCLTLWLSGLQLGANVPHRVRECIHS